MVRDNITANLYGAAFIGNNVLRVMADAMAGLAHHTLRYIDWLALQLLPDTAEVEWLDRHGDIWLTNADDTLGRKNATYAQGTINVEGTAGTILPSGAQLEGNGLIYETLEDVTLGEGEPTATRVRCLTPGKAGNDALAMSFIAPPPGVVGQVTVIELTGGTDVESDNDLRTRVLLRIRQPPMGGDANDYVQWTLAVPGTTRAWCSPLEQGMGTVTVRFMCDDLREEQDGFPQPVDVTAVTAYLDSQRPVAVKDFFVVAPIPEPIDFTIDNLQPETTTTRAAISDSVDRMLKERAAPAYAQDGVAQPAQTIFAAWVSEAISAANEVESFRLIMDDHPMPHAGALAVLGTISYV